MNPANGRAEGRLPMMPHKAGGYTRRGEIIIKIITRRCYACVPCIAKPDQNANSGNSFPIMPHRAFGNGMLAKIMVVVFTGKKEGKCS